MRKINPADIRRAFKAEMNGLLATYRRISKAIRGTTNRQSDLSGLSSGTFLVCYVAFEGFLSDLFLAYLNRDFTKYRQDLRNRVLQSVETKFGGAVRGRTRIRIPRHLPVATIESLVDSEGRNLTFRDSKHLRQRAGEWLTGANVSRIHSLSQGDALLIDAARAIRDFVGHGSVAAKSQMNGHLRKLGTGAAKDRDLGRGTREIHNVGAFLKAMHGGTTRLERFVERLRDIAQGL